MSQYIEAFTLGNAAILSNVCLLPLYPGLVVMLANQAGNERGRRAMPCLGVLVLLGIVTFMIAIGFVLHAVERTVADTLDWLLPVLYGSVLLLGVLMIIGRNPFERLATTEAPVLRSPSASAFLYGTFLAPMTLPCTGPLVVSAFVIGGVAGSGQLAESLLYFAVFAVGFGWPLVLLPLVATPVQRHAIRFLTRHHRAIATVSGVVLVGIAIYGWWTEIRPSAT